MTVVDSRTSIWEVLGGRSLGASFDPVDADLWRAVQDRLDPARACPRLRDGVEAVELVSGRGVSYVMLRSPDLVGAGFVRLSLEEWRLVELMDGSVSVARLVGEFVRLSGRLAPEQVVRVVADLAGARLLAELPIDAFRPLEKTRRLAPAERSVRGLLAFATGKRIVLGGGDWAHRLVDGVYRAGGRLFFTKVGGWLLGLVALVGLVCFGSLWASGGTSIFVAGDSYVLGLVVLLTLNLLVLVAHELAHGLAARHVGRRVGVVGFVMCLGLPSVFVDTSDVWMVDRRRRMLVSAAGPLSGLVLAGACSVLGVLVPPLAGVAFTLAFVWYLNVLFNANPFVALDGYYVLMDWLEIPNLRARAIGWLGMWVRGRGGLRRLDGEGRIVAVYGLVGLVWAFVIADVVWRLWLDRLAGVAVGLWHGSWWGPPVLVVVLALVFGPLLWVGAGRVRVWWRHSRFADRNPRDLAGRVRALQASAIGALDADPLDRVARSATWLRPADGRPLISRGAAMLNVFVVASGALEARRPGDPGGVIRQRVGAGGVVGLANAITGNPSSLTWYPYDAELLVVPATALTAAIGELPAPPAAELAELEDLLDETPQFGSLSAEAYLGLTARAVPRQLVPGEALVLSGPSDAAVVAAGGLTRYDGHDLRRGAVLGPFGNAEPGEAAVARTSARVWTLPDLATLSPVAGAGPPTTGAGVTSLAPTTGPHAAGSYPPLAVPPGPPPPEIETDLDARYERGLWWLLLGVLLFAVVFAGANLWTASPAWAEMPADRVMVTVATGTASVTVDGEQTRLGSGADRYIGAGDRVAVGNRSVVRLVFRGGGVGVLCAGSTLTVAALDTPSGHPIAPTGTVRLTRGRALIDTASTTSAFRPLGLSAVTATGTVSTVGRTKLTVEPQAVSVTSGVALREGTRLPAGGPPPSCGDGTRLPAGRDPSREAPIIVTEIPAVPSSEAPSSSPASSSAATGPEEEEDDQPRVPQEPVRPPPPPPVVPPPASDPPKGSTTPSEPSEPTTPSAESDDPGN